MRAEEKCNRCEQFGPNGLTEFPCEKMPSRSCPYFIKISNKRYQKIVKERVKRAQASQELRAKLMEDEDVVEEVKQRTIKFQNEKGFDVVIGNSSGGGK